MSNKSLRTSSINNNIFYRSLAAGNLPFIEAITATGGTVTTVGGFRYHTFNTSGIFNISSAPPGSTVEYLIIGGGGGSGAFGSGSGAGGYRQSVPGRLSGGNSPAESALTLGPGSYNVTIGSPGSNSTTSGVIGGQGNSSSFSGVVSLGGGGGGSGNSTWNGGNGASGGGAAASWTNTGTGGSSIAGQGFPGGNAEHVWERTQGGGGGGAGGAGISANNGGNGGPGLQWVDGVFRAGGGAGTRQNNKGLTGIGTGPNTGGGAEAEAPFKSPDSGVVILRYSFS